MNMLSSIHDLIAARQRLLGSIGFVPTMGYLHQGHLSLIRAAKKDCAHVIVSIFINPTQFGPKEDYESYPRNMTSDLALLEEEGVDLVWTPDRCELYPEGYKTYIIVESLSNILEGASRPGHFRGVATIVAKLFLAVRPHKAYFGQKDAQQVAVLKSMVQDLNFPVKLVICPTQREPDGLAMSSRNSYLATEERKAAVVLYRGLMAAKTRVEQGERNSSVLTRQVQELIHNEPLACIDYVECVHRHTFERVDFVTEDTLLVLAVNIGKTRLIDNMLLTL